MHTSKPPSDQVWLFQPSVISRPPPHYREIMPNYRKVIFLLPPLVNIMTITWVLCRRAVRSNELIECSTAPPPPRPTVTTVISIGMGYGLNLKSICSKLWTQRANSKSDYENDLCSTGFKVAHGIAQNIRFIIIVTYWTESHSSTWNDW